MLDFIKRNTPAIAGLFITELRDKEDGRAFYEIEAVNGKILLRGDCKISLATAYGRYLRDCCGADLSALANETITPDNAPLPALKTRHVIEQEKRVFLDYETFAYSACFWDWPRWERFIDYMAMYGINMPLAVVGSEAVWYHVLRDLGYSEGGALGHLSGPAFWPWQLLGNFDSCLALTDTAYMEKRLELGKQIFNRESELGMTPVLPGYAGEAPRTILRQFRKARIRSIPSWHNYSPTYRIEPGDPLFHRVGSAYYEKQLRLIGSSHYYACNPFNGNPQAAKSEVYLKNMAKAVGKLMDAFDSESIWVMRKDTVRAPMVKTVPKGRLLILDTDAAGHKETDGFLGHDFILGTGNNVSGVTALHGDINALAENPYAQIKESYPNLKGTGLFLGAVEPNPLYRELALDMMTQSEPADLAEWLKGYALRRYGSDEPELAEALGALAGSCYSKECSGRETGSILCARPSTAVKNTAPGDSTELRYDNRDLFRAAELLLAARKARKAGYRLDAADIVRQVLSNHARMLYKQAMDGYKVKDVRLFETGTNAFLRLLDDVDRLMMTVKDTTLYEHLRAAREAAVTDADKQNFEINVLAQLSLWGPLHRTELYDTAWREWGGLIKTYYAPRWQSFYEMLAQNFKGFSRVSTVTRKQPLGRNEYRGNGFYRNLERFERNWIASCRPEKPSEEDALTVARELLEKYRRAVNEE